MTLDSGGRVDQQLNHDHPASTEPRFVKIGGDEGENCPPMRGAPKFGYGGDWRKGVECGQIWKNSHGLKTVVRAQKMISRLCEQMGR